MTAGCAGRKKRAIRLRRVAGKAGYGLFCGLAFFVGCAASPPASGPEGHTVRQTAIEAVLKKHTEALMSVPGVIGTAQGLCGSRDCIKVFVRKRTPEIERRIPSVLEGFPVEIEETGDLRPMGE